ncbi:FKBP-type peptidyl-prolyl cis-trans isomerase [Aureispira sp. CCB-E]|uniref:FKBP-type peptidyl-prolyl cis-trans isomerase n=1 Tax=Aureispira sp. CCB-E TaxID=3051121 RepID=UPI0028685055|nr:FKBP-type peptidyl-prolyl cis-trans isomerase [Aureispira sp. CCB-E]WMX12057.1 FKBP-type peptidyl-prolyl cis-trans isomerase [Aureispira sp. CCB-E]
MREQSYSLGILLGNNLVGQVDVEGLDFDALGKGLVDVLKGGELEMTEEEANYTAQMFLQESAAKMAMKAGEEEANFMAENGAREGVVTTASGLQYEILTEGDGAIPKIHEKVVAHYEGKLLTGKIFDSSYKRGQPATFPVNGLIKGWQEALQIMPVGSKWRLYIPSNLGYGARGAGNDIPGNATLIFDLELLQITR